MTKPKFIGDITHTEKYTDKKTGEEKKKYTRLAGLFQRDDGSYSVNMFGAWLNVYPPKATGEDFKKLREDIAATPSNMDDSDIPF